MSTLRRRDNGPEMAVRRLLHAQGVRYRVCYRVPGQRRRTIDIAFPGARLAVYLDGCFWHGCPTHQHARIRVALGRPAVPVETGRADDDGPGTVAACPT